MMQPQKNQSPAKVRFSIGAKFIAITAIILLLSLGSITAIVSWLVYRDLRVLAEENNFQANRRSALEAEYVLETMRANSMMVIQGIGAAGTQNNEGINSGFFFEKNPSVAAMYFAAAGQEKTRLINEYFFNSMGISPSLLDAFSQTHSEAITRAAMGETLLFNATPWFSIPVLALYFPFQGKGCAVLFSTESLNDFFGFGANQSFLINDMGDILVHTDFELVRAGANAADCVFIRFLWEESARSLQTIYTDDEGVRYFGAFTKLNTGGGTVITIIEYDRVFEGVAGTIRRNIYLTIAVLSLSILIVWFFAKKISVPLKALSIAANNIENGSFKTNLRPRGSDEVSVLVSNFQRMSMALEKFNQSSSTREVKEQSWKTERQGRTLQDIRNEIKQQNITERTLQTKPALQTGIKTDALGTGTQSWGRKTAEKEQSVQYTQAKTQDEIKKPDVTEQTVQNEDEKKDSLKQELAKQVMLDEAKKPDAAEQALQMEGKKPDIPKQELAKPAVLSETKKPDATERTVQSEGKKPAAPKHVQIRPLVLGGVKKPDTTERTIQSEAKKADSPQQLQTKQIVQNKAEQKVQSKHATIFFSSIHKFTAKSEAFSKEYGEEANQRIVQGLNSYFSHMTKCIEKTNGVVDKFIGDALMAHWGTTDASTTPEKDAFNCITTALMMRKVLYKINQKRKPQAEPIHIGCGINSGVVTAGQIGASLKKEYTIIGEPVNITSKIKALTRPLGVDILISEETWRMVKDYFITEEMPPLALDPPLGVSLGGDKKNMRIFAVVNFSGVNKGPQTLAEVRQLLGIQVSGKAGIAVNS